MVHDGEAVGSVVVGMLDGFEVVGETDGEAVGETDGEAEGSEVVGEVVGSEVVSKVVGYEVVGEFDGEVVESEWWWAMSTAIWWGSRWWVRPTARSPRRWLLARLFVCYMWVIHVLQGTERHGLRGLQGNSPGVERWN